MGQQAAIADISAAEFVARVVEASRQRPVLVDFWAAWCQPCRMLAPILEQIAVDYAGRLSVVKVDTDREPALAVELGIRSLPTVKLFVGGRAVTEFSGAYPLAQIKALLEAYLPRQSDELRKRAIELRTAGRTDEALRLLRQARSSDPDNFRVHEQLADVLIDAKELDEAEAILKALPPNIQQDHEFLVLQARLGFARVAADAPQPDALNAAVESNPEDLDARYRLGAVKVLDGEYEEAMEYLMEIIRRDRNFRDDGGRRALVDVFTILNNEGPLVRRYRSLLSSALN